MSIHRTETYDESKCDWQYNASCCADTNCIWSCYMPCPYDKKLSPCEMCEIKSKDCTNCKARTIYIKRVGE